MTAAPERATPQRLATIGAEFGILALALSVVASFTRLFIGGNWFSTLALLAVAAWATAIASRRLGMSVPASVALHCLVGVLLLSWWFAPSTLAVVLPTPRTAQQLSEAIAASFGSFSVLVAPVPATPGFLVVTAAALWVVAGFADAAAIRFRAPIQAAVPYVATMVAVGILARDSGRVVAGVATVIGLALFAATQLALRSTEQRWVANRTVAGTRAVLASALAVALVAAVGGALLGPRLPGSADPLVDLRTLGRGDGPRTVVSPFVGIRTLLGERSDRIMFEVDAPEPAYWRLTALERFDPERQIWVSRSTYQRTDGELPPALGPQVPTTQLVQSYRIEGLATTWLPAAFAAARVTSRSELSYDSVSSSLILRDPGSSGPSGAVTYHVESLLPELTTAALSVAAPGPAELDDEYLVDPQLSPQAVALVASVTDGAPDDYTRMLRLQDWFRTGFTYDDRVDYQDRADALGAFLADRRGFCQQFASAFALFARSLGVPSRVAVGFTPGDLVGVDADGGSTFVVRGRHAHAWPEVHFDGIGWVPFEPTPQRGNPQAQEYTGVAPQQAVPPPEQAITTTTTTTTATSPSTTPEDRGGDTVTTDGASPEASTSQRGDWAPAVALAAGAALLVMVLVRSRRRGPRTGTRTARGRNAVIDAAWHDALRALAIVDLHPAPSETPLEFAARADRRLGSPMLTPLAELETRRRFGLGSPPEHDCDRARGWAGAVVEHVRGVTTVSQRVTSRLHR